MRYHKNHPEFMEADYIIAKALAGVPTLPSVAGDATSEELIPVSVLANEIVAFLKKADTDNPHGCKFAKEASKKMEQLINRIK